MRVRESFRGVIAVTLGISMMALTACGDDDSGGSGNSATSGGSPSVQASGKMTPEALKDVQAKVESHLKRPATLGDLPPVKSVPKNQTVYYLATATPSAAVTSQSAKSAAKALGWRMKSLNFDPTPEGYQGALKQALEDPATDAIIIAAVTKSVIAEQLKTAKRKNIPVVGIQPDTDSGDGMYAIGGPRGYATAGALQADYILSQTKGDANVLLAIPAAFPQIELLAQGFRDEWKRACPKCEAPKTYQAPLTSFGTTFPKLLTAYLQANRSIDWISFGFADQMSGVPAALRASGFNDLKATTWSQGPGSNAMLADDFLQMQVGIPLVEFPWFAFDSVLRVLNDEPPTPGEELLNETSPFHWFITRDTMTKAGLDPKEIWPLDATYAEEFKKVWGVSASR